MVDVGAGVGGAVRRAWSSRARDASRPPMPEAAVQAAPNEAAYQAAASQAAPKEAADQAAPKEAAGHAAPKEAAGHAGPTEAAGQVALGEVAGQVDAEKADAGLLARVARGDGAALSALYERHSGRLFGYLLRLAGDRMTAEEILQDTMLAVWRSAGSFAGGSRVSTWLFGVARRQAHNRLRLAAPPLPAEPVDRADAAPGPDELAIAAAGGTPVAAAVGRLPDHHREVIGLAFVAGLPLADVAEILGVPVGTVKSRLHHARAAVARLLVEREGVPE